MSADRNGTLKVSDSFKHGFVDSVFEGESEEEGEGGRGTEESTATEDDSKSSSKSSWTMSIFKKRKR